MSNAVKVTGTLDVTARAAYAEGPLALPYGQLVTVGCVKLWLSYGAGRLLVEVWDKSTSLTSAIRIAGLSSTVRWTGGAGLLGQKQGSTIMLLTCRGT